MKSSQVRAAPGVRETAAERRVKALALRQAGNTYPEIARQMGISLGCAHGDVQDALAALAKMQDGRAEELRAMELARLDSYLLSIIPQVQKGHLSAIDRAIRISESRRKLLGIDAPTAIQHGGDPDHPLRWEHHADPDSIASWRAGLAALGIVADAEPLLPPHPD